jgi:hypothetical protein
MEPTEIDEFRKQVEEGGENHMQAVSLIISILAVLVAMVTVMGHRTHTEAVLMKTSETDQWNEYQAKKNRQTLLQTETRLLSLQPNANQAAVEKTVSDDKAHIEKWNEDLKEEQNKAIEYAAEVKNAETKASRFDLGEALLQIAVVLSSITLLTRQRLFVIFGIVLGLAGVVISASAFLVH